MNPDSHYGSLHFLFHSVISSYPTASYEKPLTPFSEFWPETTTFSVFWPLWGAGAWSVFIFPFAIDDLLNVLRMPERWRVERPRNSGQKLCRCFGRVGALAHGASSNF